MSKIKKASFSFVNFIVRESHIVLNEQGEFNIDIDIKPKGYILKSLNQFHLELDVEIKEEHNRFNIKLVTISTFNFDPDANLEEYKSTLFVENAPAIVFPYIRAYISNLTVQSGLFTITLPTLNLSGLAKDLKGNIKEME